MTQEMASSKRGLKDRMRRSLVKAPWFLTTGALRLLYGFRVEGEENVPRQGPFILVLNEFSLFAMLVSGWLSIVLLNRALDEEPHSTMAYMQEELWRFSYFQEATGEQARGQYRPLTPHAAGRLALGLLDGLRMLEKGGIVVINPEGDMPWDGRPPPTGRALAWLGLHSAAPLVPALVLPSTYDIWPRWQMRPNLGGRMPLVIGKPFRLCETPQTQVSDEDLCQATERITAALNQIRYGSEGVQGWVGSPRRTGQPLEEPVQIPAPPEVAPIEKDAEGKPIPVMRRGIAQLLWRCPVCGTHDALVHKRPPFSAQAVTCGACVTKWRVHREAGKDFRLEVVEGSPDLVGLDMPLSTWYNKMKSNHQLTPIKVPGLELEPGEEVYLEANDVSLVPYRPNPLFEGWTGREPPQIQPRSERKYADWEKLGEGRLLVTSQRLVWQAEQGELDFNWPSITAVYLWAVNTIGVRYGMAQYRFDVRDEVGLKWMHHVGTLAQKAAEQHGHQVTVSNF